MPEYIILFYICAGAGVLLIAGGIWLIYKEKIYLDVSEKKVLDVDLPLFGKLQVNAPALVLFFIGCVLLIYPIAKLSTRYVQVEQVVMSDDHPVAVYVAVQAKILHENGKLVVSVPLVDTPGYQPELIYLAGRITDEAELELNKQENGILELPPKQIEERNPGIRYMPEPIDPLPDAYR